MIYDGSKKKPGRCGKAISKGSGNELGRNVIVTREKILESTHWDPFYKYNSCSSYLLTCILVNFIPSSCIYVALRSMKKHHSPPLSIFT